MIEQYAHLFAVPIAAGFIMAALCGVLGPFVLLKRLSFLTDTLAHACTFGIALGLLIGVAPQVTLLPFAALLGFVLSRLSARSSESLANLTAVAFTLFLGLGTLLLSFRGTAGSELVHMLFGDVLWVRTADLLLLAAAAVIILPFLLWNFRGLVLALIHRDLALTSGIAVDRMNDLFLILVAVTLALCTKIVGVLLVSSLLVLPAFIASHYSTSLKNQIFVSLAIAIIATVAGFGLSFVYDFPVGPSISSVLGIGLLGSIFFHDFLFKRRKNRPQLHSGSKPRQNPP